MFLELERVVVVTHSEGQSPGSNSVLYKSGNQVKRRERLKLAPTERQGLCITLSPLPTNGKVRAPVLENSQGLVRSLRERAWQKHIVLTAMLSSEAGGSGAPSRSPKHWAVAQVSRVGSQWPKAGSSGVG